VVGREAEIDLLTRSLRAARKRSAEAIVLVGEGGIGKTRLLNEAIATAHRLGMAVLTARAPVTAPPPYCLVAEALRSWLRAVDAPASLGSYDRGIGIVLPEWPFAEAVALDDAARRLLSLESIVQLLRTAADGSGALLVLDDVHGGDAESIEALRYAVSARVEGLVVLAAMRPAEHPQADELVRALRRALDVDIITLSPLDERAVSDLATAILDRRPAADLVADLVARTDGVPLLVEEVVLAHDRAETPIHGGHANVPRNVADLAAARLQLVGEPQREVLVAAAVLGDFDSILLPIVAAAGDAAVGEASAAGVRVGLLESVNGGLAFRHAIIRDAVLAATVPHVVDMFHRRAVDALEALPPTAERFQRVAQHLRATNEDERAARALVEAARLQLHDHALLAAEATARAAAALARDDGTRADAADTVATVLVSEGRWSDALALDALTVAAHGEDPARRRRMASAAIEVGRPEVAEVEIEAALRDGDASAELVLLDGRLAVLRGDPQRALARAASVADDAASTLDERLAALDLQARSLDFTGDREGAAASWEREAAVAAAAGRTQARLRAVVQLGKLELFMGRPPQRLHEAVDLARDAGALVELGWAQENLSIGLAIHGDLAAAKAVIDDAIDRCEALDLDQLAYLLACRGMQASFLTDDDAADLDAAEAMLPNVDLKLHLTSMRADIALRAGRYDEAIGWFEECDALMSQMPGAVPMDAPCWLVWALAAAGRTREAEAALERARAIPDLERWFGRPIIIRAAEAMLAGDVERLDRELDDAEAMMPMDVAHLRQLAAAIVGGPDTTRWLRAALDGFAAGGATVQADRIRQLLRDAGGSVPRRRSGRGSVPAGLADAGVTARESEVLRLLGDGRTNAEIAERLYVSVRTVEAHVSSLLARLAARNRAQLATISTATDWERST
jgi:DNA-binding CsgD family transcriptional regulator/tetratricopeptide (TPR) repeat protein